MSNRLLERQEVLAVKRLGEEIGYGNLMAIAHELWARMLEDKYGTRKGAHVVVGSSMVKDEYREDAERDPVYEVVVGRVLSDMRGEEE